MTVSFTGAKDIGTIHLLFAAGSGYKSELRALTTLTNEGKPHLENFSNVFKILEPKVKNVLQVDLYTKENKSAPFMDELELLVNGAKIEKKIENIPLVKSLIELYEDTVRNIKDDYTASTAYAKSHGFTEESIAISSSEKAYLQKLPAAHFHHSEGVKANLNEMIAKLKQYAFEPFGCGCN